MRAVDIIIPTYNRKEFLPQAIESALAQTYDNKNIIISDNASTDGTYDAILHYLERGNVHYFCNKSNIGISGNWSKALKEYSKSDIVILLSDDDVLVDHNYISDAMRLFDEREDVVIVHANQQIINERSEIIETYIKKLPKVMIGMDMFEKFMLTKDYNFNLSTVLFKKELVNKLSLFSSKRLSIDYYAFLILCLKGYVGYIDRIVSSYRIHSNNNTRDIRSWYDNIYFINDIVDVSFGINDEIDFIKWKRNMYKRYLKVKLAPRVLINNSLNCYLDYYKLCIDNKVLSGMLYIVSVKNVLYAIKKRMTK